jgi:multidrug resistance efflux pump
MPAKRRYKVKGTNDFLILAAIFFFLCLWAIKDAWFPSEKVLKRHPREVTVAFAIDGTLAKLHVAEGDEVVPPKEDGQPSTLLASLSSVVQQDQYDKLVAEYKEIKKNSPEEAAALHEEIKQVKAELDGKKLYCPKLGDEKGGKIAKIYHGELAQVKAGEPVFLIEPKSTFYLFNKSLTVLSFILFWVFMAIHVLAR